MRKLRFPLLPLLLAGAFVAQTGFAADAPAAKAPSTEEEKTAYAIGLMLGRNLGAFELTPAELALVQQAIADSAAGRTPAVKLEEYQAKIQEFAKARGAARAEKEKAKGAAWAAEAAKKPGATTTASGLVYRETLAGTGASPSATDKVKVHYRGTLIDGTEFDSSIARGTPAEFGLNQVVACWTEALQKMKVGGKASIVCPSSIAYGDRGRPSIPPGATLNFDIELLDIVKPPAAAPAAK
jgi:FKBP-type peptidyl-prolyl cis-trans isomerase FkpA